MSDLNKNNLNEANEDFYEILLVVIGMIGLVVLWKYKFVDVFGVYGFFIIGFLMIIGGMKVVRLSKSITWKDNSWANLSEKKKERFGINLVLIVGLIGYAING